MSYLLHIGFNKTGSSAIQHYLSSSREFLLNSGICYPSIGLEGCAHHELSKLLLQKRRSSNLDSWIARLEEIEKSHEVVIISSEHLRTHSDIRKLADVFPQGRTKIFLYVREHYGFLSSWYQQSVQSGVTAVRFEDFIQIHSGAFCPIIKQWEDVYGENNVRVAEYAPGEFLGESLVSDFSIRNNLPVNEHYDRSKRFNPSLSGNLLEFVRLLNYFCTREETSEVADEIRRLLRQPDQSFRGALACEEAIVKKCRWMYREDRKDLRHKYGVSLTNMRHVPSPARTSSGDRLEDWLNIIEIAKKSCPKLINIIKKHPILQSLFSI